MVVRPSLRCGATRGRRSVSQGLSAAREQASGTYLPVVHVDPHGAAQRDDKKAAEERADEADELQKGMMMQGQSRGLPAAGRETVGRLTWSKKGMTWGDADEQRRSAGPDLHQEHALEQRT